VHERFPRLGLFGDPVDAADEKALCGAAARESPAKQSRSEDARVVDDKQIAGLEQRRQILEAVIRNRARLPIEDE
jgi:hypothetical protein